MFFPHYRVQSSDQSKPSSTVSSSAPFYCGLMLRDPSLVFRDHPGIHHAAVAAFPPAKTVTAAGIRDQRPNNA
ncbi:uncharacterized [Tachysurus ichikawai]